MNYLDVHQLYVQGLQELNFDQCMKAVGILNEKKEPVALWLEAEVLYLRGEYENCLYTIGNNRTADSFELNEYYLACLLMLGRYRELRREIRDCRKLHISWQCGGFIEAMMRKQNEKLPYQIDTYNYSQTPFQRIHLQFVVQELIDVYELQADYLQLASIGSINPNSGFGPDLQKRLSTINIQDDYISAIRNAVETATPIDPILILDFFKKYFSSALNDESIDGRKGQLRDILNLLDLERRLGLYSELKKSFQEYKDSFVYSIYKGNRITAGHLKEILFDLESKFNKLKYSDLIDFIRGLLDTHFPEMLREEERLEKESRVYQVLHDQTKPMYKAAVWQYNMVSLDMNYGYRDAGMYCLSYVRLLECEMNQRVFPILEKNYDEIKAKSVSLSSSKKNRWNINRFNPDKASEERLTAGQWNSFFTEFNKKNMEETFKQSQEYGDMMVRIFKQEVFNDLGYDNLVSGRIAEIFDQTTIINRYRNPPAHTKYVTVSIANECRRYVEDCIIELSKYYK